MRTRHVAWAAAVALVAASAVTVAATPAEAATTAYYVDAAKGSDAHGNGSSKKPWRTIGKAAALARAGDTVKIRSGTYRETVRPKHSGTAGSPVTFEPDAGADVTVSGADLLSGAWAQEHDSIYSAPASLPMGDYLDQVYVDGVANNLARSPNTPVGNNYDPKLWNRNAAASNGNLLNDPVNLDQPAGTWDGAALFVEDSGSWNFSSALVKTSTPGNLQLDRSQESYSVRLSTYDDTVKLMGPGGAVLGEHGMPLSPDTRYRVTVSAIGSDLRVFVDGRQVIAAKNAQVAEGTFGFGLESSSAEVAAKADFTNVNAVVLRADPAHEPTGLSAPTFASNIDGWTKGEETGWWESDGRTMHGFTQPQSKGASAMYETTKPAKDFVYSADLKPLTDAVVSMRFRKELSKGYVIDLADWGLGGSEYFIMGKPAALDYPGEWFYDKTSHRLQLRTTGSDSPAAHRIEYKARNLAFDLAERSYIEVKGVKLFASAIDTARGSNNVIDGIKAKYVNDYNLQIGGRGGGICVCGTNDTLKNSEIGYASGSLVTLKGQNNKLVNNLIHDGTYGGIVFNSAVEIMGSGHLVSNNTMYHSGRSLIGGEFSSVIIQYNDVHHGNYFAHDTGLLYVAHNDLGNSEIHHNYWHDNVHRSNGEGDWTCGVYLDEASASALIYNNVTWNLDWEGIVVNRLSNFVQIYNNTTYENSGIRVSEPTYGLDAYGDRVQNNIATNELGTGSTNIGAVFSNNLSEGDPLYADPAAQDFRLKPGSPARDRGTPVRGITEGFTGTAPDIGAFEAGGPTWKVGHDFAHPPDPRYQPLATDYQDLMVNGSLDLNRIADPTINSLRGWTRTHSKTAQPTYDHADGAVAARYHFKTGVALGTGEDGIEQKVTGLKPNTTYKLRGFLRANSEGQQVRMGVKDYGGPEVYEEHDGTAWAEKTITFATGPASTSATIYGYKPTTGGYGWVDDIYLYAPPITLSIADTAVAEGNSSTTTATVKVSLVPAGSSTVTVDYATSDDTAVAGEDYTAASGTLTFAPGETSKDITVTVSGDTADEPDERFNVTLSDPAGGASISDGTAFVTISNDEPPPDGVTRVNDRTTGTGLNQFEFSGSWGTNVNASAYQNDVTFSMVTGDYYQVRFSGTQVRLYSELGSVMGIVGVSVDGGAESMVDNYSAASAGQVLRYTSPVLPAGEHILKVRVTGTKNDSSAGTWTVADRVDITS